MIQQIVQTQMFIKKTRKKKNRNRVDGADARLFDFCARIVSIIMKCSHLTWKSMNFKLFKNTLKC